MATSEIEKLERRYTENPHGLTFAPLAEVHRKNGDVSRALDLLHIGLELHPNYIPASIVLGRCHQDLGDLAAAEAAFAHVLRLDDENVIALKSLADIGERQERWDDAERWLRRLVSVDRSNDEARAQLQRVESAKEQGRQGPVKVAEAERVPAPATVEPAVPRSDPGEVTLLDLSDVAKKPAVDPVLEPAALKEAPALTTRAGLTPPELLVREPESSAPAEKPAPLAGLESSEFQPPKGPTAPLGLEIETEADVVLNSSGAAEFSVPDASQDFAALAAKLNAARPRSAGRRASDRTPTEAREPVAKPDQPAAPQPASPEPQVAAPAAVAAPLASPPLPPVSPSKPYSARETKGQSIAAFFQALLVARPPATDAAGSSSSNSNSRGQSSTPSPTPVAPGKDGLVSFDDFFGAAADGSSIASGEPGKDDLDQFHSWLQNLKP
jgi:tetratricopeptide (TPR) repeat protein